MKVYVAIWEDRHSDTEVFVFNTSASAIKWAMEKVREYAYDYEIDETLTESMIKAGLLYRGQYSPESDSIRVVEVEVINE